MPHRLGCQLLTTGHDRDQFGNHSLGKRDVGRLAGQGERIAAYVNIGSQNALEGAQIFVGGTQQAHDEVGRNINAAANRFVRVSVRLAGRHVELSACFLGSGLVVCYATPILPPVSDASQCLTRADLDRFPSEVREESLGERVGMLPVHEMPAADLLNDVLVVEHPGGVSIVRRLDDRIIQARKDDRWHRDSRLQ